MKKVLSNNHGYTLYIVLMTIVIFTILALSFTVQTASSKKQNIIVEENYQSKALAEMGSQYYMTAIKNEFDDMKLIAETTQEQFLSTYKPEDITEAIIQLARQKGIEAAYFYLSNKVHDPTTGFQRTKNVNELNSSMYLIENVHLTPLANNMSTITFDSIGIENGIRETKDIIIKGELELDLSQMNVTQPTKEDYVPPAKPTLPSLISDPALDNNLTSCSYSDITKNNEKGTFDIRCNSDKTIAKVEGSFIYKKLNDNINILYVTGDLTDGNGNDAYSNLSIHVGGNLTLGNFNNASNVTIEIMGKATIPKNLNNAIDVTICAHGGLELTGNDNNTSNIKIYDKNNVNDKSAFASGGACVGISNNNPGNPGEIKYPSWTWDTPLINKEEYIYN